MLKWNTDLIRRYARYLDASMLKAKRKETIARAACLRSSLRIANTEANESWRDIKWQCSEQVQPLREQLHTPATARIARKRSRPPKGKRNNGGGRSRVDQHSGALHA
jgi:hypothetical protein